jgi:ribosomal protein S3AE
LAEDEELRKCVRELAESQIKSVVRSEIHAIIKEELRKKMSPETMDKFVHSAVHEIVMGHTGFSITDATMSAVKREVNEKVVRIMEGMDFTSLVKTFVDRRLDSEKYTVCLIPKG